jgi:hypothetical protein
MSDERKPRSSADAGQQPATGEQKTGGFGAFAQRYRDRWAAEHPNRSQTKPAGDQPESSAGADASDPRAGRAGPS